MSHVTFSRKRVKLKKLLGIRARLALLALILVAPLMLERARSLEDARAKQIAAASPVAAINPDEDAVVISGINLDWMSKIMNKLGGRPGISSVLVDSTGIVLAAPTDQTSMIGRPLDSIPLLSAIAEKALASEA